MTSQQVLGFSLCFSSNHCTFIEFDFWIWQKEMNVIVVSGCCFPFPSVWLAGFVSSFLPK